MAVIATASITTIDANGNIIDTVQTVGNMKRIRKESGWTKGDGDRSDLQEMGANEARHAEETFGRWGRDPKKDIADAKNTRTAYEAIGQSALASAEVHESYREAQTDIAEVMVRMAQADAKTAKKIAKQKQRIEVSRKEVQQVRENLRKKKNG